MAIDWEAYRKKAKKRDEYEYQKNIMNNDIAPVRTTKTYKAPSTKKSEFEDGYQFGDITRTILGTNKAKKQETSSFDDTLTKKYSTMSLKDIEKEYARIEKEEKKFKDDNGGKFINYLTKAGSYLAEGKSGVSSASVRDKSQANIDKIDDYTREKEIINMYRKQKATEEYLGGLSDEQLQLLDNISKSDTLEDIAPIYAATTAMNGGDTSAYYKATSPEREIGKSSREKLAKQLKKKNPDKKDNEINELIDNMVELRRNQVNAEEQAELDAEMKERATEKDVSSFVLSRGANILGGFTGLAEMYLQRDNEYGLDTNAPGFMFTNASNSIDEQIQLDHDWTIDVGGTEVDAFDFFYKAGTGLVDNVGRLVASGGNTTMAGAMMFTQATTQSIIEGKEKGYSDAKALTMGLLSGTFEAISEKVSLDVILDGGGSVLKSLAKSFVAEGGEEVTSNWLNRIADEVANGNHSELSKMYDAYIRNGYSESQALAEVVCSAIGEDVESFLIGGISGATMGGSVSAANSVSNRNVNKLTENERKVVEVEYENRIAESETAGSKLTKKQKKEIKENVLKDLDKGYISIDTIESALGGETYNNYTTVTKQEDAITKEYNELGNKPNLSEFEKRRFAELEKQVEEIKNNSQKDTIKSRLGEEVRNLVKDSRLAESYNEKARRGQSFEADLSKYDAKQQEVIKKAVKSGVLNNTNRTHEFVDMIAKISADKGVSFDFTNNEKLKTSGFAVDGETVNGFVDGEGNITLNANSSKWLNSVVGHEITHILEGTELYSALQEAIKQFATAKGEYAERMQSLRELYTGVYKGKDFDDKLRAELTADIVGDYLFTDSDFINSLSTEQPNLFKKIYNEIKYLCKIATAGSKEARKLEKVKREFDKAYKESANTKVDTKTGVNYSLSNSEGRNLSVNNLNPTESRDIRYSLSETDNNYLSAVEKGDTETAQKMVEEAAKKAGYNSPKLYHGTKGFGFTKIKTSGVEAGVEWSPFFATNNIYTALTYSGKPNKTEIGKAKRPKKSFKILRDEASELLSNGENATTGFVNSEHRDSYIEQYGNIMDEDTIRLLKLGVEGAYAIDSRRSEFKFVPYEDGFTAEDYSENSGNYGLYAKTDGFLVIDGENREWNEIRSEYGSTTRLIAKNAHDDGYKGVIIRNVYDTGWDWSDNVEEDAETVSDVYIFFEPQSQVKSADAVTYDDNGNVIPLSQRFNEGNNDIRYSLTEQEAQETNDKLNKVGFNYDVKSETISYSLSSLEDAFNYKTDENGLLVDEDDYLKARNEYVDALAKSIAMEKGKPTREEYKKADRYLDSLFLVHDMIAADKDRLDYEAAANRSAWVGNVEYGGSIDFSTLCAKRRLFTGTFDAIQNELPDTVLTDKDFLNIRNLLLEHGEESPCSMCYVEGSRAKHGIYVNKWLKEYLKTNPEWKPQIADFTSTTRLEQTRIQHPEAYAEYVKAMNKLSQRKPKEASVRTDYKGEILHAFSNDSSVETKNKNGGIRFNSFSDFEIIHALDCMQVLTDMSRVGLNGQAYTKVKEFAESFGNTGLKINLSLVAKDVDANGKLVMDETNGMNYAEAMDIRNRYSENVGTVIVVFNDEQLKSALADNTIDFVLPFHRSQWRKSQYALMGLPEVTRDYTNIQNDRYTNPKTNRPKKAPNGNIMPNEYWDFTLSGRENAQKYLDYINENAYIPKFDFLLDKVDGKWVLPNGAVGDGYFKLLIDFKMYNNDGVGSPQKPVLPEFNMPYIQQMLNDYVGGHQAFPVAHDVVDKFVEGKKNGKFSLSKEGEHPIRDYRYGNLYISGEDVRYQPTEDIAPTVSNMEKVAPVGVAKNTTTTPDEYAPMREDEANTMRNDIPIDDGEIAPPVKSSKGNGDIEQPIAKILTKEPDVKKKSKLWSKIKTNFIDKASPFETLALKTGNREVDAKFNSIRYADSKAQTLIGEGAEGVKSLNDIQTEVENDGLTQSLYEYLYHKHNVDRMTLADRYDDVPNKAVFGNSMTAELSQKIVDKYESENPKLVEYANDIYTYNRYLRNLLVEGGVISQETADLWEEMYPHYVPIRRVGDEGLNINVALDTGRTGINAPVKRATGGNRDILPLFDTMAQRTLQTYKAIAKNRFGIELKNTLGTTIESTETSLDEVIDSIDTQDSLLQEGKNGRNPTFTVFENGEKVTFEITEEMYDAMKPTSEGLAYTNKVANTVSNAMRGVLTEYNPTFMLTNAIKDAQDVFINSQHPARTYKNFPKTIKELTTKGKWYTEYMQNGGADNTYFDKQTNSFNKEKSGLSKAIGFPLEKISEANNFIERIPRLAEYIASREMGRSIDVSMLDAARVTTNFSAGGDVTKFLNRNGATFLNASVQGATQQVRNIREAKANGLKGWVQLATKVALAGLPVLFLNGLLWDDDEEYEDLSDYVKQNYYVVAKMQDGKFVRIPKGRAMAVIQEAFTQVHNALTGDDEVDLQNFLELAVSNLAPNNPLDNNIIAPIKQVIENKTWYGEDLVPTRLQDVPGAEQYDESTDAISKWLGEKLNYSPYKINYLLDQYSGGLGDVVLPMLTPKAESGDNSMIGFLGAPMRDKFSTDSVFNNQNTADFYNVSDELKVNANSSNATDEDVLKSKYFNSISTEISDMYKEKREIQNSNLSDAVKYKQVRDIQEQINQITENALNTYENVKINGSYANIGDRHYRLNDDGEWQKITDEQLEKQNEVIGILGITPSQYWGNKAEYDMKAFYPEKYKVLQEQGISVEDYKENYEKSAFLYTDDYSWAANNPGKYTLSKVITDDVMEYRQYTSDLYNIKADKDSNGKSISGSRKKKVVAYINSLDIEDGAKYVLWKSQYPADKTYNKAIFEYINGRSDITRDEKITILEELGAKVDSNGNVRW